MSEEYIWEIIERENLSCDCKEPHFIFSEKFFYDYSYKNRYKSETIECINCDTILYFNDDFPKYY